MKIKLQIKPMVTLPGQRVNERNWTAALPFVANPRGKLVHRIRSAKTHIWRGEYSHDSCSYWCGNGTCGDGLKGALCAVPPDGRLVCLICEAKAVAAGEPTTDELAGKHCCKGKLIAIKTCCRSDGN